MTDRILVVDDEPLTRRVLEQFLGREGFAVVTTGTAASAVSEVGRSSFDLVLLDLILPDGDGISVCRRIRARSRVPIIILSTKRELADRVTGLDTGADDYIVKPFELPEVLARVRAQLRRAGELSREDEARPLVIGDLVIETGIQDVIVGGTRAGLTQKEFRLVQLLAMRAERAVGRDFLIDQLWPEQDLESAQVLTVCIRRVRQKIETNPDQPRRLVTIRGYGYMLTAGTE